MSWGIDPVYVEQFGKNDAEPYKWFRPVRALISYIYYWIKHKSEAENVAQLPLLARLEPSEYVIVDDFKSTQQEYDGTNHDRQIGLDTNTLKALVTDLENRGGKVLLYELPYPGKLGESHYATTVRQLAREGFSEEKWLKLEFPIDQLRWSDAAHMDERSAIIVAKEIERAIK